MKLEKQANYLTTSSILKSKNKDIENKIGNFTFEAYDKRDKANQIEDEAIKLLERRLKEIAEGKT